MTWEFITKPVHGANAVSWEWAALQGRRWDGESVGAHVFQL